MKNVECRMKLKYGYEVCRMKLEVSNNACSKILEDSPFNIDHASYPFCVEPIKVLEVFINQGVVTFNLIFKKCPRTFVHGGLYHKGFNQGPRPPLPPPCPSLVNPH